MGMKIREILPWAMALIAGYAWYPLIRIFSGYTLAPEINWFGYLIAQRGLITALSGVPG